MTIPSAGNVCVWAADLGSPLTSSDWPMSCMPCMPCMLPMLDMKSTMFVLPAATPMPCSSGRPTSSCSRKTGGKQAAGA